jgi:hypothetical protein
MARECGLASCGVQRAGGARYGLSTSRAQIVWREGRCLGSQIRSLSELTGSDGGPCAGER